MSWLDRLHEFVCHRCGNCCKGEGFVWLSREDIRRIAAHLGLGQEDFVKRYTRMAEGRLALIDHAIPETACVFYEEGLGCAIHAVKPKQCADFPIRWREEDAITYCKGLQALDGRED
jgi:Fe-S-cluster containining protein